MRQKLCRVCGSWHEMDAWPHNCLPERNHAASDLPVPNFISDAMEPIQSMANGKWYESKSAIRATYLPSGNADGIRYQEVGNDPARLRPKAKAKPDKKAIRDTIHKAEARFNRGERILSK